MSLDADAIYHEITQAGESWSDLKSAYEALDDNTKSVLAELTGNFLDGVLGKGGISKTEAEMRALASGQFKVHLASVSAARKAFLRAQVKYDSLKMLAELRRSQESTRRQEMRL